MADFGVLGRTLWGEGLFGGPAVAAAATIVEDLYTLRLCSNDGDLVAYLPNWIKGQWTQTINQPSLLEIAYPYQDDQAANLAYPRCIQLYDRQWNHLDTFRIMRTIRGRDAEGRLTLGIIAHDLLAQLGREKISSYEIATNTAVSTIIAYLLSQQGMTYVKQVSLGKIAADVGAEERKLKLDNQSILEGIRKLHESVGGIYWVDADGKFSWKREVAARSGQQIRLNKNLQSLEVDEDWEGHATRVVALGAGLTPDDRLTATANSTNQGTYGIITEYRSWPDVDDSDTLTALATEEVRRLSTPKKTYRAGVIDLSLATTTEDYRHEAITLGERVRVIDANLGEAFNTRISMIRRDLASPLAPSIEVQNSEDVAEDISETAKVSAVPEVGKTLTDAIADIIDDIRSENERDSKLTDRAIERIATETANNETALTTIAEAIEGIIISDEVPQNCAGASAAGEGTKASDDQHVHGWEASSFVVDLCLTLLSLTSGANFEDTFTRIFFGANIGALDIKGATLRDGDLAYTSSDDQAWFYSNGAWTACLRFT